MMKTIKQLFSRKTINGITSMINDKTDKNFIVMFVSLCSTWIVCSSPTWLGFLLWQKSIPEDFWQVIVKILLFFVVIGFVQFIALLLAFIITLIMLGH